MVRLRPQRHLIQFETCFAGLTHPRKLSTQNKFVKKSTYAFGALSDTLWSKINSMESAGSMIITETFPIE